MANSSSYLFILHIQQDFELYFSIDSSNEILVGNVNLVMENAEDIYGVDVKITSEKEECFLQLDFNIKEKKNFNLLFDGNVKVPLFDNKKHSFCNKFQHLQKNSKLDQTYLAWEKWINDPNNLIGFKALYYREPEVSAMEHTKVKQKFITNITFISQDIHILVNMSVWGGPIATWRGSKVSFDTNGQLHGLCQLNLKYEFFNKTGHHDFLQWSLKSISGHFMHGKLEGKACLITWRGLGIYATFRDGELHGPVHSIGRKFLFDVEVRISIDICTQSIASPQLLALFGTNQYFFSRNEDLK